MVGVLGIDPDVVKVPVRPAGDIAEALSPVSADDQRAVRFEYLILIFRVDDQIGKVKGAPDHGLAAVKRPPGHSSVVRAIEAVARRLGLDEGIDDIRLGGCHSHRDSPPGLRRKARGALLSKLCPARSAVGCLEKPAPARHSRAIATRAERPPLSPEIPESRDRKSTRLN